MRKRSAPYLALILGLIALAPLINLALKNNPFRFAASLADIFLVAVVAAVALPEFARAFVPASVVVLSLALIESVFALFEPTPAHIEGGVTNGYVTLDTPLGYAPNPGVFSSIKCEGDCARHQIYNVSYTIEDGGFRHTPQGPGPGKTRTALFVGDSATFGEGLNDDETLPYYFAKLRPDAAVFNFAFHGYGAHQVLRALETGYFDRYTGGKVDLIVFPTTAWHAERSSCLPYYTRFTPKYGMVGDEAVYAGRCPDESVVTRLLHQSKAYEYFSQHIPSDLFHPNERYKRYLAIIKRAQRIAKEKYNARFVVGFVRVGNSYFRGTQYSDERILAYFKENGIETVDITLADDPDAIAPSLLISGDGHPSARAQFLRAQIIAPLLDAESARKTLNPR